MKRPPGLWVLLSAGVLWLSLQDVYGIRATSLIFGKSSTTTSTTESSEAADAAASAVNKEEEGVTEHPEGDASNVTKPTLTGIPQIDYIYDPNLPQELNGYNLSEYPFYERVPEDIDFKCDGLHDGFYASVPHKCQVYHHCLFGTRYDFLCANYTAFDQKTFICHFVSEVDCVNSKKFWHRNDALYQAASTTTIKPQFIYTPPPNPPPILRGSGDSSRPPAAQEKRRPHRRPVYQDYDDYEYQDYYAPRRPGKRRVNRPRKRPVYYDDDYEEEYEDDRYDRRGRRPYDRRRGYRRRPSRDEYEDDYEEDAGRKHKVKSRDEDAYEDDERDRRGSGGRRHKKPEDDVVYEDEDNVRGGEDVKHDKKPKAKPRDGEEKSASDESRRKAKPPADEETYEEDSSERKVEDRRRNGDKRQKKRPRDEDSYDYDDRISQKGANGGNRRLKNRPRDDDRPRRNKRPIEDDYEDDRRNRNPDSKPEEKTMVKPVSGSIYDRERPAPRIKRPVPKNEADKYAYKASTPAKHEPVEEEEYYDDYEEFLPKRKYDRRHRPKDDDERRGQTAAASKPKHLSRRPDYEDTGRMRSRKPPRYDSPEEDRTREEEKSKLREQDVGEESSSGIKHSERGNSFDGKRSSSGRKGLRGNHSNKEKRFEEKNESKNDSTDGEKSNTFRNEKSPEIKTDSVVGNNKREPIEHVRLNNSGRASESKLKERKHEQNVKDSKSEDQRSTENNEPRSRTITKAEETRNRETSSETSEDKRTKFVPAHSRFNTSKNAPTEPPPLDLEEYEYEYDDKSLEITTTTTTTKAPSTTEVIFKERPEQIVRIVKRPFLPSRGGNPFTARGLQPVGAKAEKREEESDAENPHQVEEVFKPSPILIKIPRPSPTPIKSDANDLKTSRSPFQIKQTFKEYNGPRTTQKPKIPERNPLDIGENEYDVTLNDALNPTLPNLAIRSFPNPATSNDYTFSAFQRPRLAVDSLIGSTNAEYVYQPKPPAVRPQTYRDQYVATTSENREKYVRAPEYVRPPEQYVRATDQITRATDQYVRNAEQFARSPEQYARVGNHQLRDRLETQRVYYTAF